MKFVRYLAVGGIMLIFNLLVVWVFVSFFHIHYLVASSIAFFLESIAAFFINRTWTFQSDMDFKKGYMRFFVIGVYSFFGVLLITYGFVHILALHYIWARTFSGFLMGFIGYFLDLKITFRV